MSLTVVLIPWLEMRDRFNFSWGFSRYRTRMKADFE